MADEIIHWSKLAVSSQYRFIAIMRISLKVLVIILLYEEVQKDFEAAKLKKNIQGLYVSLEDLWL